jgi:hypothetical protein
VLRHSSFLAAALLVIAVVGCGPSTGTISGTVTVNAQPATSGIISFVPADGKSAPVTVDIHSNGQYSAQAVAGPKQVQISIPVVTGKRPEYNGPGAPLIEITEESVPAKYNSETKLTFDLKPGANQMDWAVDSSKRK